MTLPKSKSLMMFAALATAGCPLNQCVDKTAVTMMNYIPLPPGQEDPAPTNVWVAEAMSNGPLSNFLLTNFSTPGAAPVSVLTGVHAAGITAYYGAGAIKGLYLWSGNTVYFLNDQTGAVNASIAVCLSGSSVLDFVVGGTGAAGYATCSGNPMLNLVTFANALVSPIPMSAGASPNKLAVSANGDVFVTDAVQPIVYQVQVAASKINTINIRQNGAPGKPAIIPDGTQLWVPFPISNSVAIVDIHSGTAGLAISEGFVDPREIVFSPSSDTAYILNSPAQAGARGSIVPVDTGTFANSEALFVGANPAGLFISPAGGLLFVANSGDGTVSTVQVNGGPTITTDVGMMPVGVVANHNPEP